MRSTMSALSLLFLILATLQYRLSAQPPPLPLSSRADLAALYSLRSSLGLRARNWPRKADPCSAWSGVGCAAGRVVSINLSGLRRTRLASANPGFSADALRNLTRLSSFNSTGFPLPGPIPDPLAPPSLSVLVLQGCSVSGPIPFSIGSISSLAFLDLSANSLTGDIPSTLSQLSNLSTLDLSGNVLSGSIPPSLATLTNLTSINLSTNFLTGPVPLELSTLPKLTSLSLSNNTLTGPVPPQLGDLARLVRLDLSINSLSGGLPDDLRSLKSLRVLDVGGNRLSGILSNTLFSNLNSLAELRLSRNNFTGALPNSLWTAPGLRVLDVSYNSLTGALPDLVTGNASGDASGFNLSNNLYYGSVGSAFGLLLARYGTVDLSGNYFQGAPPVEIGNPNSPSLQSNCFVNALSQRSPADCQRFYTERGLSYDGPAAPSPAPSPPPGSSHKSSWRLKYILIGVFAGIAFLGLLILVIVLCLMRRRATATTDGQRESSAGAVPSGAGAPASTVSVNLSAVGDSFAYEQLLRATMEFSDSNLIKNGHSGDLYRGVLEDGVPVVVKRINIQVVKEVYAMELDLFSKTSHTRLVPFLGHCMEHENEKLLVYKYMHHGDLSHALYRKPVQEEEGLQSLDWITRLKIATGAAEALCFLHHECTPPLVHRDIQASSILLDDKFEVRLGSLSEVCAQEGDGHQNVITRFLRMSSQLSDQNSTGFSSATCTYDVYCFGKVLLELVTGRLGISGSNDASTTEWLEHTLPYINIYEKELVTKIVDPSLVVDEDLLEEVWAMAIVAKSCLNPKPSKRPPVRYILKALENPLKVVREENNSGSGGLRDTSSRGSWNAAFFGSWRKSSSDIASLTGPSREDRNLKRSGTMRSQGSNGEHSFSLKKPSKEIFPEPSGAARDIED